MKAYEECLGATSTTDAPWCVIPADNKGNAWLITSQIILDTFKRLKLRYPETTPARRDEQLAIRKRLAK